MLAQPPIARTTASNAQAANTGAHRTDSVATVHLRVAIARKTAAIPSNHKAAFCPPENGSRRGICACPAPGACTVNVVVPVPLAGFTLSALKLQLPPAGRFEHAHPSTCLNPFFAVTVIFNVPLPPGASVSDVLLIDSE